MTSAQTTQPTNDQINEHKIKQTTEQIIALLITIIPNYDNDFWNEETELFGAIAEFDSMALVTLIGEIEEYFDITLDDDDISADNFSSVATLTELVLERS